MIALQKRHLRFACFLTSTQKAEKSWNTGIKSNKHKIFNLGEKIPKRFIQIWDNLSANKNKLSNAEIVTLIKEIVPEYISNNSKFEILDKVS